jgi:hypothetical protein
MAQMPAIWCLRVAKKEDRKRDLMDVYIHTSHTPLHTHLHIHCTVYTQIRTKRSDMKSVDHATMLMSMLVSDMAIATASWATHTRINTEDDGEFRGRMADGI